MDSVKLTIDGQTIEVKSGTTILEAAKLANIYIPTLCFDDDLEPYGGCRLCVVEIEKMRGFPTSCTTPATDGMVVHTDTAAVNGVRRATIDLLISDHPMDCLTCIKNQHCELQRVAAYLGITERRLPKLEKSLPVDTSNPFFKLDRNYCILCARCTRTCDEITMMNAIEIFDRGYPSHVSPFADIPIIESICSSCGECVVHCPVAALVPKQVVQPTSEIFTTCPYCGVGCGMILGTRASKIVSVRGDRDNFTSKGRLCVKGRYGVAEMVNHPQRLQTPLIKRDGKFVEASWDEALDLITLKFSQHKGNSFAGFSSAKCTNEDNYIFQKFVRTVMGTNNVDHCARLCHAPSVAGLAQTFGSGAMTNSITEIADATTILAIGTNTTEAHPVIGFEIKKAVKQGAKLIVANPREINLVRFATIWLKQNPGSDVALLMGMMRVIVDENLLDEAFIAERTENYEVFKDSLVEFTPQFVEKVTGVPWQQIVTAARMYAANKPSTIIYAMGITQHSHGTDNVIATANLAMLTGNIGKSSTGVNPLRGQNNVQGACDMGALPNVYPGYQAVAQPENKDKFEKTWGYTLSGTPGLTITEIVDAAHRGEIKTMYIMGENPMLSEPTPTHTAEAFEKLDFFVVQDIFLSETARLADVVLPTTSFAEKDGTFTNTERRVQRVRKVIEPVGNSRPDWLVVCQIARKMGSKGFDFQYPSQIMDEIARVTPSYGGVSFPRLDTCSLQWPCPTLEHPGTPVLHTKAFTTKSGKGRFIPLTYRPPQELPDTKYPLTLTTGRSLYHFHTGTMTRKVEGLNVLRREELVEINPADALHLKIDNGNLVRVISRRGEVKARAKVTEISPPGVVFMTFHFAESPTNLLTNPALDPVAKIPEYKVCAVKVEKVDEPDKIVV